MKKALIIVSLMVLALFMSACGESSDGESKKASSGTKTTQQEEQSKTEDKGETEQEKEEAPKATPIECGDSIETDNFRMTFDSVELVGEYSYRTSEYSSTSIYVGEGYQAVLIKGKFENKSSSKINTSSFVMNAKVNGVFEDEATMNFAKSNSFSLDPFMEEVDYIIYVNVPNKLAESFQEVVIDIGFNGDMSTPSRITYSDGRKEIEADTFYCFTSGLITGAAAQTPAKSISIGEKIETTDYEFTLKNVSFSYEILPANASGVYSSYSAESGKVFVDVVADVKNLMPRDIRIDELYTASAVYDGTYPYSGFTVVNDDNDFDWVGSYVAATPLETCLTHSIIECPAEVSTSGKTVVVNIQLGEDTYEFALV